MTPKEFIDLYIEYFGEAAPLPLAVVYSDAPMGDVKNIPGCMFKQFHRAYNGETVTFSADNLSCGGGKLYVGLGSTPQKVYNFVSMVEKYKVSQSPDRGLMRCAAHYQNAASPVRRLG